MAPRLMFALLTVVLCSLVRAQEPPTPINLPVVFEPGARHELVIVIESVQIIGGARSPASRTTTPVTVTMEKKEGRRILHWAWKASKVEAVMAKDSIAKSLASVHAGVSLEIEVDAFGRPLRLVNADAVAKKYREARQRMVSELGKRGLPEARIDAILFGLDGLVDPATVGHSALTAPRLVLAASGRRLTLAVPVPDDGKLPSPFGGEDLPASGEMILRKIEAGRATVCRNRKLMTEKANAALRQAYRVLLEKTGNTALAGATPIVKIHEEATVVQRIAGGWPESVRRVRSVEVGGRENEETTIVTLVKAGR